LAGWTSVSTTTNSQAVKGFADDLVIWAAGKRQNSRKTSSRGRKNFIAHFLFIFNGLA
jgi:hypothetical protein